MSSIIVDKTDIKDMRRGFNTLHLQMRKAANKVLLSGGNKMRNHIIKSFNSPKTGIKRPRTGAEGTYRSSAPGETPAVDTGRLRNALSVMPDFHKVSVTSVTVGFKEGSGVNYAIPLELMLDRPFMKPAAQELSRPIMDKMEEEISKVLALYDK